MIKYLYGRYSLGISKEQSYRSDLELLNDINNNKFDKDKTKILRTLLEQSDDPAIKKKYEHYGYKGGSTMKVLNGAYYVTDKDGKKKSLAFFLNNLNAWESYKANQSMKAFRDKVLEDEDYRRTLEKELKD